MTFPWPWSQQRDFAKFRLLRIISEVLESTWSSQKSDSLFWRFGVADPWRWAEVGAQCNWSRHHYISFSSRDGCMHCLQGWQGLLSMTLFPMSFFSCRVLKFGDTKLPKEVIAAHHLCNAARCHLPYRRHGNKRTYLLHLSKKNDFHFLFYTATNA